MKTVMRFRLGVVLLVIASGRALLLQQHRRSAAFQTFHHPKPDQIAHELQEEFPIDVTEDRLEAQDVHGKEHQHWMDEHNNDNIKATHQVGFWEHAHDAVHELGHKKKDTAAYWKDRYQQAHSSLLHERDRHKKHISEMQLKVDHLTEKLAKSTNHQQQGKMALIEKERELNDSVQYWKERYEQERNNHEQRLQSMQVELDHLTEKNAELTQDESRIKTVNVQSEQDLKDAIKHWKDRYEQELTDHVQEVQDMKLKLDVLTEKNALLMHDQEHSKEVDEGLMKRLAIRDIEICGAKVAIHHAEKHIAEVIKEKDAQIEALENEQSSVEDRIAEAMEEKDAQIEDLEKKQNSLWALIKTGFGLIRKRVTRRLTKKRS